MTTPYASSQMNFNENLMSIIEGSCTPTFIDDENGEQKMRIYPNPASDYIFIDKADFKTFAIHDVAGRLLIKSNTKKSNNIFIGNLSKGIYYISIKSQNDSIETFSFVKK